LNVGIHKKSHACSPSTSTFSDDWKFRIYDHCFQLIKLNEPTVVVVVVVVVVAAGAAKADVL